MIEAGPAVVMRGGDVNKKPSRWDREGFGMVRRLRCADDVCRLEAFGAFQQVKLHGLTLVEGAVAVLLDRGEVHEHVFSRGALDKSIPFRPVEPLHCTFLSHGKNSFHQLRRIILQPSRSSPRSIEVPLKEAGRTFWKRFRTCNRTRQKEQTPQSLAAARVRCVNFRSPIIWRVSTTPNSRSTAYWSHHRTTFPVLSNR